MIDRPLDYEYTMRLFLGDKAYQIAGTESNTTAKRQLLRKLCKTLLRQIDKLDTTNRHRASLMYEVTTLNERLKIKEPDLWGLIYVLLRLVGRLLGYHFMHGVRPHTPMYYQTPDQHFTDELLSSESPVRPLELKRNAIVVRRRIVAQLIDEGMSDFDVSLVLRTSEYEVKKLLKDF